MRLAGTLTLVNKTDQPIADLYAVYPQTARAQVVELSAPARLADAAPDMRWHHYVLGEPLAPGATIDFRFDLEYGARGFRNDGADPVVLDNGSFLNSGLGPDMSLIPSFGYDENAELSSDSERRKFGLAPKPRMHNLDDKFWQQQSACHATATSSTYRAQLCTDTDQLPITRVSCPGLDQNGPTLHRLPDGFADGRHLSVSRPAMRSGATPGAAPTAMWRSRSTISLVTNTTSSG